MVSRHCPEKLLLFNNDANPSCESQLEKDFSRRLSQMMTASRALLPSEKGSDWAKVTQQAAVEPDLTLCPLACFVTQLPLFLVKR